jgi:hypothetical protein
MPALGLSQVPLTTGSPPAQTMPAKTGQTPQPPTVKATSFSTNTTRTIFAPLPVDATVMAVPTGQQNTDTQKCNQTVVSREDPSVPVPVFTPTLDASSNALVLDPTQKLSVGEVLTYGREVIGLATAAGSVADGTVIVISGTMTETVGLGAWIADGMGIQSTGVGIPFRGESARRSAKGSWWVWLALEMLVFAFDIGW